MMRKSKWAQCGLTMLAAAFFVKTAPAEELGASFRKAQAAVQEPVVTKAEEVAEGLKYKLTPEILAALADFKVADMAKTFSNLSDKKRVDINALRGTWRAIAAAYVGAGPDGKMVATRDLVTDERQCSKILPEAFQIEVAPSTTGSFMMSVAAPRIQNCGVDEAAPAPVVSRHRVEDRGGYFFSFQLPIFSNYRRDDPAQTDIKVDVMDSDSQNMSLNKNLYYAYECKSFARNGTSYLLCKTTLKFVQSYDGAFDQISSAAVKIDKHSKLARYEAANYYLFTNALVEKVSARMVPGTPPAVPQ